MNIKQIITEKSALLRSFGIDASPFELKLMLASILHTEPKFIRPDAELTSQQEQELADMLAQRLQHRPVDKIIGRKGFYKYDFAVNDDVLSPRCDSEILVETGLNWLQGIDAPRILELGVGSGCLILSLLSDLPTAMGIGIDISPSALKVAAQNAELLHINSSRLKLVPKSWFDADIVSFLLSEGQFDLLISNPPYIPSSEIGALDAEVRDYDPLTALDGGADGLRDYRRIVEIAPLLLKEKAAAVLEAGDSTQLAAIGDMGCAHGLSKVAALPDLSGQDRCIILKK
ncbi:MAG: peptide chain release factor N(5)-glutamine methyltransferase [Alphaproteobacteria bacterium]|nr:peptide chain release factor N(5)-glutamine methyltransferase [Alphaproteobacteria bacterium]MBQ9234841.1 peptide chain release factor N(5)-glutamine methyltransferase [Alphaproteobacteria bacterium]